jgi:hypothetical protein
MEFAFQDTMMMGADYYQTESEIASLVAEGKVPIGVGQNTKIRWDLMGWQSSLSLLTNLHYPKTHVDWNPHRLILYRRSLGKNNLISNVNFLEGIASLIRMPR